MRVRDAPLDHEALDDAVEGGPGVAKALLAGAQLLEVLHLKGGSAAGRSLPSLASGSQRPICIVIVAMFVVGVIVIVAFMCRCPMFVVITGSA